MRTTSPERGTQDGKVILFQAQLGFMHWIARMFNLLAHTVHIAGSPFPKEMGERGIQ